MAVSILLNNWVSRVVRIGHRTTDWFQVGKGVVRAVYCHTAYLIYMQSISCEMLGWMKRKLESRLREKYQ